MSTDLDSLFQSTAGLSQELLFEADLDGAIQLASPAWNAVLGWSDAELRTQPWFELIHPDDVLAAREAVEQAAASASIVGVDARCPARDGTYRRISWKLAVLHDRLQGAGHELRPTNAQVVHDINNQMQTIVGALELVRKLLATGRQAEAERFIASAVAAAHRASELNQHRAASAPAAAKTTAKESTTP